MMSFGSGTYILVVIWILLIEIATSGSSQKEKWSQSLCSSVFSCDEFHMDIENECFMTKPNSYEYNGNFQNVKHLGDDFHAILQWDRNLINSTWLDLELYGERTNPNGTFGIRHVHMMRQIPNVGHLLLPSWLPAVFYDLDSYDCMFHLRPKRKINKHRSISEIYNFESFFEFVETCDVRIETVVVDESHLLEQSHEATHLAFKEDSKLTPDIEESNLYFDIVDEFLGGALQESSKITPISEEEKNQSIIFRVMMKIKLLVMFTAKKFRITRRFFKRVFRDRMELYCYKWHLHEKSFPPSYDDVPLPPCSLGEALANPEFVPDKSCSNGRPYCQFFHNGAYHCVRSVNASWEGAGQQACYDKSGKLLDFEHGGGTFDKAHISGYTDIDWSVFPPKVKVFKIWRLSHLVEDVWPFLACCKFTNNCKKFGQVRPTQLDCDNYKEEFIFG